MAPTWLAAEPAVEELRPSRMSCRGAGWPEPSRAAKSGGILSTSKAFSASTISAICRGEVSVAARTNTPVPSIRASSSVDAALRL